MTFEIRIGINIENIPATKCEAVQISESQDGESFVEE
jgi:hypothetical protein